jgi:hypothetical protein
VSFRQHQPVVPGVLDESPNHREFVLTGWRYFCLWSSEADTMGWHVYKVEIEEVGTKT